LGPAFGWLSLCKVSTNSDLDIKRTLVSPAVRGSQWHHFCSSDAERWRLWISPWQTMRRAIRWEVTEYPMRVDQYMLPRTLTLGFVYSVIILCLRFDRPAQGDGCGFVLR